MKGSKFRKPSPEDSEHGGEWLTIGLTLLILLKKHGSFSALETILEKWMKALCPCFKEFPVNEQLYAIWACSNSQSPVYNMVDKSDKLSFYVEFKKYAAAIFHSRSAEPNTLKEVNEMHDTGVDLVNGFFCRSVDVKDGSQEMKAAEMVPGFYTGYLKEQEFIGKLKYHLDQLEKINDERHERTNGMWSLLFFVTHITFVETEYLTKDCSNKSSFLCTFISEFCLMAGQNKTMHMSADSLSEILLCVEMIEINRKKIYFLANKLASLVPSDGNLPQEKTLKKRASLHSKLTSAAALARVLLFIDNKQ